MCLSNGIKQGAVVAYYDAPGPRSPVSATPSDRLVPYHTLRCSDLLPMSVVMAKLAQLSMPSATLPTMATST